MKKSYFTLGSVFVVSFVLLIPAFMHAEVLMLDFGPTPIAKSEVKNSPYHTLQPTFSGDVWNAVDVADVYADLYYSDGAVADVSIRVGRSSLSDSLSPRHLTFAGKPVSAKLGNLMYKGVFKDGSAARDAIYFGNLSSEGSLVGLSIEGLAMGHYEIYIVGANTNLSKESSASVAFGSFASRDAEKLDLAPYLKDMSVFVSNTQTDTWVFGENYAKLELKLTPIRPIIVLFAVGASEAEARGFINMIQVVKID